MVLHKDELLGFCKILFLRLQSLGGVVIILDLCIFIDRISCLPADVVHDPSETAVPLSCLFRSFLVGRQHWHKDLIDVFIPPAHRKGMSVQSDQQIEDCPENGQQHDHQHPCHADRSSLVTSVNAKDQKRPQNVDQDIDPSGFLSGKIEQQQDDCHLQQNRNNSKDHSAHAVLD